MDYCHGAKARLIARPAHCKTINFQRRNTYPTGTDCPSLPRGADTLIEFQVCVADHRNSGRLSGPLPIRVAFLSGAVTLPSSIRYASEAENTNLPLVMSADAAKIHRVHAILHRANNILRRVLPEASM